MIFVARNQWPKAIESHRAPQKLNSHDLDRKSIGASQKRIVRQTSDYVGSNACKECHGAISANYEQSRKATSVHSFADRVNPTEDYADKNSFFDGPSEFQIERTGDRVWHHEILRDDQGLIFDQAEEMRFVIGSGSVSRTYLMFRDGGLYLSPILWFAQQGWAPGPHAKSDRFSMRVSDDCVQCHAGRPLEKDLPSANYPEPVFYEAAIGCERCHGPGRAHIEQRRLPVNSTPDPIINPSKLNKPEQDAVCFQCHFESEHRILRKNSQESNFRPGQKMSDVWLTHVFEKGTKPEEKYAASNSQSLQMQSSQCYIKSQGRLGCISCHDPHLTVPHAESHRFYQQKCLKCHSDQACSLGEDLRMKSPANGSCIQCHMPTSNDNPVPHVSRTSHLIRRSFDSNSASVSKEGAKLVLYTENGANILPDEATRATRLMIARVAQTSRNQLDVQESIPFLKQSLLLTPNDEDLLETLASAYEFMGRTNEAENFWLRILERSPLDEQVLLKLANSNYDHNRHFEASGLFARLTDAYPWNSVAHARYALVLASLGQTKKAIEQAQISLKIDPTLVPMYHWLSLQYRQTGQNQRSIEYEHLGRRLQARLSENQ